LRRRGREIVTDVPASVVQTILREARTPDAVLLRGAASILRGEPQNDIDIFLPRDDWTCTNPFGRHQVVSDKPIGAQQRKLHLKEADTDSLVEIDVFHQLTWRGIRMADITTLPNCTVEGIETKCLTPDAEAWLTVVKNVLHGSPTPERKLADMDGRPVFHATHMSAGSLRLRLDAALTAAAWAAASEQSVSRSNVWRARGALILLRLLEAPFATVSAFLGWVAWRMRRKVVGS
jgi:hypothetical protein